MVLTVAGRAEFRGANIRAMAPNRFLAFAALTIASLTAVAVIPLLAACSTSSADTAATHEQAATGTPGAVLSGDLTVFAAASLTESFDALSELFMQQNPKISVKAVYDGSSTLATQLVEGASADVFASADEATMSRVVDAGALNGPALPFASNTLQIAVRPGNPLGLTTLSDLGSARLVVVLCAPAVPCGAASVAVLKAAGVTVTPASEEQNVKAVVTKVELGEADAGLVYTTDVQAAEGRIEGIPFEGADAAVNHYLIGSPAAAANPTAAARFIELVRSAEGQRILAERGFGPR
ncbi:molybdate ABC transporter substrate-binding protein [Glaciibacter psychrotolerans]|uniref:Molybdate transport system substrate-binding protein n=1 Tax=Glaciibacter psychrotolerans TaxID=670054 RepID=A0A7Z0EHL3_9MICO|nr:molybdate ABC transporter substrate-binding protein [Leifsonia psychrotolerans]NYJ21385.1 molybdate transport system substrate-binding protein [Leifsonia psychrotolerans]